MMAGWVSRACSDLILSLPMSKLRTKISELRAQTKLWEERTPQSQATADKIYVVADTVKDTEDSSALLRLASAVEVGNTAKAQALLAKLSPLAFGAVPAEVSTSIQKAQAATSSSRSSKAGDSRLKPWADAVRETAEEWNASHKRQWPDDVSMRKTGRQDASDLKKIARMIETGKLDAARAAIRHLDTIVRDAMPQEVWDGLNMDGY